MILAIIFHHLGAPISRFKRTVTKSFFSTSVKLMHLATESSSSSSPSAPEPRPPSPPIPGLFVDLPVFDPYVEGTHPPREPRDPTDQPLNPLNLIPIQTTLGQKSANFKQLVPHNIF